MNLQTIVDIPSPRFSINYRDKGLFVGSCFATSLQEFLSYRKADVILCSYGEMYNPLSISSYFKKETFSENDVIQSEDGLWYSWYHHGSVYSTEKDELLDRINNEACQVKSQLENFNYVVITLGTSWIFELADGRVVSNCHKMPSSMFSRRSLTLDEILDSLRSIISLLPNSKFILTVSPIRHIKDGLIENSYSKSLLRVAAGILQKEKDNVYYYPSYEIMNDELRDYRFYRDDMLHPTEQAASYIMEKFVGVAFDENSRTFFLDIVRLKQALSHRPLHVESLTFKSFQNYRKKLLNELINRYPEVDFSDICLQEIV